MMGISAWRNPSPKCRSGDLWKILLLALSLSVGGVYAADDAVELEGVLKQGRAKAQGCTRCHGRDGMAKFVREAKWDGSISTYVIKQLLLFRGKRRTHEIMSAVSAPLTNIDIYEIALWYESVSTSR